MTPLVSRRPGTRACLAAAASALCHATVISLMISLVGGPAGEVSVTPEVQLVWTPPPDRLPEEPAVPEGAVADAGTGSPAQPAEADPVTPPTEAVSADPARAMEPPEDAPAPAPDIAEVAPMPIPPPPPLRPNTPRSPARTSRALARPPSPAPIAADTTPAPSPPVATAGTEAGAPRTVQGGGASASLDGALKAYARTIWMKIQRARPANAAEPGVTVVAFAVATDGSIAWARITATSGLPTLDRTALDTVRRAAPLPPPPPGAAPEQLVFSVPFSYR